MQTTKELEQEYYSSLPRLSPMEWTMIFPESKDYVLLSLMEAKVMYKRLEERIKKMLRIVKTRTSGFEKQFLHLFVGLMYGSELQILDKRIRTLQSYRYKKEESVDRITQQEIEKARNYPLENLIEIKKDFATCPFHASGREKTKSLYCKNSYFYCFACGWGGDSIALLMERDKLSFYQAVRQLQN